MSPGTAWNPGPSSFHRLFAGLFDAAAGAFLQADHRLAMHKMVVNQAMLAAGLEQTQMMATVFDGITRHNPEGLWFRRHAQNQGFKSAVEWRDSGRAIPEGDAARDLVRDYDKPRR